MDWIKLHRKILDSAVSSEDELLGLFTRILLSLNYKSKFFKGFEVKPGQMLFAWRRLPQRLYPKSNAKPAVNTLRRRIALLQKIGVVEIHVDESERFSVLTVPNWQKYQSGTVAKIDTVPDTVADTVPDTVADTDIRRFKKDKKVKKYSSSTDVEAFESFWKSYPVRTTPGGSRTRGSKQDALKAWEALSDKDRALAVQAVKAYADSGQIPKDCERWLKGKCWDQWLNEPETADPIVNDPTQWADSYFDNDDAPPKGMLV